jgi:hypothetical protein
MILIGELRSWDRTGTVGNLTHRAADHIEQAENDRRKGVEYIARLEGALREAQETIIKQGNELARRTSVETDGPCQACGGIGCKHCSAVETTGKKHLGQREFRRCLSVGGAHQPVHDPKNLRQKSPTRGAIAMNATEMMVAEQRLMLKYRAEAMRELEHYDRLYDAKAEDIEKLAHALRHQDFIRATEPYRRQKAHVIGSWLNIQARPVELSDLPDNLQRIVAQWDEMIAGVAREFGYPSTSTGQQE